MRSTRVYIIRQRILRAAADMAPGPVGIDDLEADPALRRIAATRAELVDEYNALVSYGYLAAIPEANGEYARITPAGRDQINQEAKRDHRIWGRDGL